MGEVVSDVDSLVEDLSRLLEDQDTADVVFLVGEKETVFRAHKLFLWARYAIFSKM